MTELPQIIAAYIQAENNHNGSAIAICFSDEAIVYDDGQEIHGPAAIKAWSEKNYQEYQHTTEVIDVDQRDNQVILTTMVTGTFEGSPIQLHRYFTLNNDKIVTLRIQP